MKRFMVIATVVAALGFGAPARAGCPPQSGSVGYIIETCLDWAKKAPYRMIPSGQLHELHAQLHAACVVASDALEDATGQRLSCEF
ncbi:MAG: hypothetical protein ACRDHY_08815 [Anaerolineales bacterium]